MARVIDRCPYWLQHQIRDFMAEKVMRGLSTDKDDELRRIRQALEWLELPIAENSAENTVDRAETLAS
jgi:hypothetical protein